MLFLRLSTHYCFSLRIGSGSEKDNLILFIRFCLIMYFRSLKCMFVGRPCIYGLLSQIYSEIQDFNSKCHHLKAWINPWVSLDLSAVIQICVLSLTQMIGNTLAAVLSLRVLVILQTRTILNERCEEDQIRVFHLRRRDVKNGRSPKCSRVDREACE